MLDVTAEMIADSLASYRELPTAEWILTCRDHELAQVCLMAHRLLNRSDGPTQGTSIIVARAVSLAAVCVHEGHPRALARQQRRRLPTHHLTTDAPWQPGRRPLPHLADTIAPPPIGNGPTPDAWEAVPQEPVPAAGTAPRSSTPVP